LTIVTYTIPYSEKPDILSVTGGRAGSTFSESLEFDKTECCSVDADIVWVEENETRGGNFPRYMFENPSTGTLTCFDIEGGKILIRSRSLRAIEGSSLESKEVTLEKIMKFMDLKEILKLKPECF